MRRIRPLEAAFTLYEVMIVVAMVWILGGAGIWYLDRQPMSLNTAVAQFDAMLRLTRSHAAAMAGGPAFANTGTTVVAETGATLYIQPDPGDASYSVATLYWYRPIKENHCNGCVIQDSAVAPLRLHTSLMLTLAGASPSRSFALFVSPSQHLSAILGGGARDQWQPQSPPMVLSAEPPCSTTDPPVLTFSIAGQQRVGTLACNGSWLDVPTPGPSNT